MLPAEKLPTESHHIGKTIDEDLFFSGVSSLTMKTLLQVRLDWWDRFLLRKEEEQKWEDKDMGLELGQQRGATSKQPHCNATALLFSDPWRLTAS